MLVWFGCKKLYTVVYLNIITGYAGCLSALLARAIIGRITQFNINNTFSRQSDDIPFHPPAKLFCSDDQWKISQIRANKPKMVVVVSGWSYFGLYITCARSCIR